MKQAQRDSLLAKLAAAKGHAQSETATLTEDEIDAIVAELAAIPPDEEEDPGDPGT